MKEYRDANEQDFAKELVGKKIVKIDTDDHTLLLNDGTKLEIEDAYDCCAWYRVSQIQALIDLTDNVVTAVRTDALEDVAWDTPEKFDIVILSNDLELARIGVEGDPTSGYYCHSVTLTVSKASDIAEADESL